MSLQTSYRYIAPIYDFFVSRTTSRARQMSLSRLPKQGTLRILLSGAGTGLDFPFLPIGHQYTALDFNAKMLLKSHTKGNLLDMKWVQGDCMTLPFQDESFDHVILHLILAVVEHPERCLAESTRVLKPGGKIWLFDKFLHPGERAWVRRTLSLAMAKIATRLDVVFEEVLANTPKLIVISDQALSPGGWFRLIELTKQN